MNVMVILGFCFSSIKSCAVYILNDQNTRQQPKKQELGEQVYIYFIDGAEG